MLVNYNAFNKINTQGLVKAKVLLNNNLNITKTEMLLNIGFDTNDILELVSRYWEY